MDDPVNSTDIVKYDEKTSLLIKALKYSQELR